VGKPPVAATGPPVGHVRPLSPLVKHIPGEQRKTVVPAGGRGVVGSGREPAPAGARPARRGAPPDGPALCGQRAAIGFDHVCRRAHRADPSVSAGRRHCDARPVRPAPGQLRRLHRVGPGARVRRGLHPRRGAAALREHAHRVEWDRAADHTAARGRPPHHPRRGRRRRRHSGDLLRVGFDGGGRQDRADPRAAGARAARRPLPFLGWGPRRRPTGRVRRPVRTPQQRAAVAGVGRRRRPHPAGP
jgi:hypothetical protein